MASGRKPELYRSQTYAGSSPSLSSFPPEEHLPVCSGEHTLQQKVRCQTHHHQKHERLDALSANAERRTHGQRTFKLMICMFRHVLKFVTREDRIDNSSQTEAPSSPSPSNHRTLRRHRIIWLIKRPFEAMRRLCRAPRTGGGSDVCLRSKQCYLLSGVSRLQVPLERISRRLRTEHSRDAFRDRCTIRSTPANRHAHRNLYQFCLHLHDLFFTLHTNRFTVRSAEHKDHTRIDTATGCPVTKDVIDRSQIIVFLRQTAAFVSSAMLFDRKIRGLFPLQRFTMRAEQQIQHRPHGTAQITRCPTSCIRSMWPTENVPRSEIIVVWLSFRNSRISAVCS